MQVLCRIALERKERAFIRTCSVTDEYVRAVGPPIFLAISTYILQTTDGLNKLLMTVAFQHLNGHAVLPNHKDK